MPKVAAYLAPMELGPAWMEWGLLGLFLASFLAAAYPRPGMARCHDEECSICGGLHITVGED